METYSSPISLASCWAEASTRPVSRENCGADTVAPEAAGSALTSWSSSLRTWPGSAPTAESSGAARPSVCASSAPSRCSGRTSGWPATVAACTAEETAC